MIDWINVKDQMPNTVGSYLISFRCHTGQESIYIAYIEDNVFKVWDDRYGEDIEIYDVTHWAHITYPSQVVSDNPVPYLGTEEASKIMQLAEEAGGHSTHKNVIEMTEQDLERFANFYKDFYEEKSYILYFEDSKAVVTGMTVVCNQVSIRDNAAKLEEYLGIKYLNKFEEHLY